MTRQKQNLKMHLNIKSKVIKLPKAQISKIIQSAASAIEAKIQKKIHGSGTTTLIISNAEMNHIMKTVQVLEDSDIILKEITKKIENETKE